MDCKVSAHFVPEENEDADEGNPYKKQLTTLYVIKFDPEVMAREEQE